MIPAGHTPIDKNGIAELHGLTSSQAARRRPWSAPDHPAPITRGQPTHGRPRLWDTGQAAAHAEGRAVPALPTEPHPDDLLDRFEAAEYIGVDPTAWERDSYRNRTPSTDAQPYGVPHWTRATLDQHATHRQQPHRPAGGRPTGVREQAPRRNIGDRVAELLTEQHHQGEEVNIAEIARALDIHYTTAHRHVTRIHKSTHG